jgi:hypothetical protein
VCFCVLCPPPPPPPPTHTHTTTTPHTPPPPPPITTRSRLARHHHHHHHNHHSAILIRPHPLMMHFLRHSHTLTHTLRCETKRARTPPRPKPCLSSLLRSNTRCRPRSTTPCSRRSALRHLPTPTGPPHRMPWAALSLPPSMASRPRHPTQQRHIFCDQEEPFSLFRSLCRDRSSMEHTDVFPVFPYMRIAHERAMLHTSA